MTYFLRDNTGRLSGKPVDFEDAIILAGYGRFQRLLLLTSGLCLMAVIIELLNIGYVLPSANCDLQLTTQNKGILGAMIFVGMMVSSHTWGFLADTKGRKYVLIFSLLLNCLCTIATSFAFSFWMLAGLRFLNGIFICGPSAVTYAYLAEFHSRVTRTKAIVLACSFIPLGFVVLAGLAWLIIPQQWTFQLSWYTYSSWRIFQLLTIIPGLVTATLLLFHLPESPKYLLAQGKHQEALRVLQHIFTSNSGCRADQYPVTTLIPDPQRNTCHSTRNSSKPMVGYYMWKQTWPLFVSPHLTNMMLLCMFQFGLFLCENGILLRLPDLLGRVAELPLHSPELQHSICNVIHQMQATPANRTLYMQEDIICSGTVQDYVYRNTLIFGGVTMFGYVLTAYVINLFGRKTLLFMSLLASGCAGIGLYFVSETYHIMVLACIFVVLSSIGISIVSSATVEVFPTNLRAMAMCISLMMGHLGTIVASVLMGLILEVNCNFVFFIHGGIVIVCGFLSLLLPAHSTSLPPTLMT